MTFFWLPPPLLGKIPDNSGLFLRDAFPYSPSKPPRISSDLNMNVFLTAIPGTDCLKWVWLELSHYCLDGWGRVMGWPAPMCWLIPRIKEWRVARYEESRVMWWLYFSPDARFRLGESRPGSFRHSAVASPCLRHCPRYESLNPSIISFDKLN